MLGDDPWVVLGLESTAGPDEIRQAYRSLLKKHKPERDPEGFRRIREAHDRANELVSRRFFDSMRPFVATSAASPLVPVDVDALPDLVEPDDTTTADDTTPDGARFPSADDDAVWRAVDALEARFWAIPDSDPLARARVVFDALGTVDDDTLRHLLGEALYAIGDAKKRRDFLAPYAESTSVPLRMTIATFAPSLFSDGQLEALETEVGPYDRLTLMIEWARRNQVAAAMRMAEAAATEAGNGVHAGSVVHSLAVLGLELLALERYDEAVRIRELAREADLARAAGHSGMPSIELVRFRALLKKSTVLGMSGMRLLALSAVDRSAVRVATEPVVNRMAIARAARGDPTLEPLSPRVVPEPDDLPRARPPGERHGEIGIFSASILVVLTMLRVFMSCDGPQRVSSSQLAARARSTQTVWMPSEATEFSHAIESAAANRSCDVGYSGCVPTQGRGCMVVSSERCRFAEFVVSAIGRSDCEDARRLVYDYEGNYVRGGTDEWSTLLRGYVESLCSDGGTGP